MTPLRRAAAIAGSALAAALLHVAPAPGSPAVGVWYDNSLMVFDTAAPGTALESRPITGLAPGYVADDVDVRPSTGQLYLLAGAAGGKRALYGLDPGTGAATRIGGLPLVTASGRMGIDFEPGDRERLRVVSSTDHNLRVDPDTAEVTAEPGLDHPAAAEDVASIAHRPGDGMYGWDFRRRRVVRIAGSAVSDASTSPTGPAGAPETGFDVAPGGGGMLLADSGLHRLNPATGTLSAAGTAAAPGLGMAFLAPAPFELAGAALAVYEGAGSIAVGVARPHAAGTMSVRYSTADGSATLDDYGAAAGTLTFPPGVALRTFEIPIEDDSVAEPPQTVEVSLARPSGGGSLGSPAAATLTIHDDDALPHADRIAPGALLSPAARRLSIRALARRGLRGAYSCSEACRAEVALRYRRWIVVGAGGGILPAGGPGRFTARLSTGGKALVRKRLRRRRRVKLALVLTAIDAAGNRRVVRKKIVVTRR